MGAFPQDWSKSQSASEEGDNDYHEDDEGPPFEQKAKAEVKAKAKAKGKARAKTKASMRMSPPPAKSPTPAKSPPPDEREDTCEKQEREEAAEDQEEQDVKFPFSSSSACAAAPPSPPPPTRRGRGGRGRGRGRGTGSSSSTSAWRPTTKRPGAGTRVRVVTKGVTKSITKGIAMKMEDVAEPPPMGAQPDALPMPKPIIGGRILKVGSRVKFGTKDEGATIVKFIPADVPFPKVVKKRPQGQKRTADRNLNIVNLFKKPAAGRYVVPHSELWTRKPGDLGSGGTSILNVDRGKVPGKAWWEGRTKTYRGYPLNGKPSKDGFSSLEEALVYARTGQDNVTGLTGIDSNVLRIAARPGLQDALLNLASRKKVRKNGYSSEMMYEAVKSTGGDVEAAEALLIKSFQ